MGTLFYIMYGGIFFYLERTNINPLIFAGYSVPLISHLVIFQVYLARVWKLVGVYSRSLRRKFINSKTKKYSKLLVQHFVRQTVIGHLWAGGMWNTEATRSRGQMEGEVWRPLKSKQPKDMRHCQPGHQESSSSSKKNEHWLSWLK